MFGDNPWIQQMAQRFQRHRGQRGGDGQRGAPRGQGQPTGAAQGGGGVPPWAGVQMGQPTASPLGGPAQPMPQPQGQSPRAGLPASNIPGMQPGWLSGVTSRLGQPPAMQGPDQSFGGEQSGLVNGGGMNRAFDGQQQQILQRPNPITGVDQDEYAKFRAQRGA